MVAVNDNALADIEAAAGVKFTADAHAAFAREREADQRTLEAQRRDTADNEPSDN